MVEHEGSPPHTRGKFFSSGTSLSVSGITPAYAGKTRRISRSPAGREDHPRIRGENVSNEFARTSSVGSPPHTRGKPPPEIEIILPLGITPAYAGKIAGLSGSFAGSWDHPRIRGENVFADTSSMLYPGSPPHTRGKCVCLLFCGDRLRITPAYAGKMRAGLPCVPVPGDHPRIRGENCWLISAAMKPWGSPPHTRGKSAVIMHEVFEERITPAYAGKIARSICARRRNWDHPRIRGENSMRSASLVSGMGSPPHTRGKCFSGQSEGPRAGITPAYAGKI